VSEFTTGDGASIHYEVHGDGFPVLLIAPGGMRSAISFWSNTPWNPIDDLKDSFKVVAMDQRNAGASTGPIRATDGWPTFTADQLALMDHLGAQQFHVAGMCIGGPYALGLIQAAPTRVTSAVLFQTIGREDNRDVFFQMFDNWADALKPDFPDVSASDWDSFRSNMYGGDRVFFNVDVDFIESCTTPLLVLCGNDVYHPESASRTIVDLAPDATFIESWKQGAEREVARQAVRQFLLDNTP